MWHRGQQTIKRRWWRIIGKRVLSSHTHVTLSAHAPLYLGLRDLEKKGPLHEELNAVIERAISIANQRFSFLGESVEFADEIRWNNPDVNQLWRYNLHYFDYVRDLLVWAALDNEDTAYATFKRLALSWIENNSFISGDGWHPYTISLRLVNWLFAFPFFSKQLAADTQAAKQMLASAHGQARFLFSNLELDVRGNHLLENLRAVIWAGIAFEGPEARKWLARGMTLLEIEVREQVLSDGGHFERCPGYSVVVFRDLLEIAIWLSRNKGFAPEWLDNALRRMADYLWKVMPPNEKVPLLKDSAWDATVTPLEVISACAIYLDDPSLKHATSAGLYSRLIFSAEESQKFDAWTKAESVRSSIALPATGHYVIRDDEVDDYLIFDAGKPCPDYLPAHAHADLLTYELFVEGRQVIVDSGVYEYTAGAWRDFFRSTRAHNTVEVAEENQSEVWSSFRVGRRARPGPVWWEATADHVLVQGEHDGYERLSAPVVHQRTIFAVHGKFWLIVDQLWGDKHTSVANHLHLHPDLSFELEGPAWRIGNCVGPLWMSTLGEDTHSIVNGQKQPTLQGWYSEVFGSMRSNSVLTLRKRSQLPICFGYVITRGDAAELSATPRPSGHEVRLRFGGQTYQLQLFRNQRPNVT